MDQRVFRMPPMAIAGALLFVVAPLLMAVAMTDSFNRGEFKMNGQISHDPSDLYFTWTFLSLFALVGIGMTLATLFTRVEVDTQGIKVFNFLNQCRFTAPWVEVTRYERGTGTLSARSNRFWKISAGERSSKIPNFLDYGGVQRAILVNVPPSALAADRVPETDPGTTATGSIDVSMRGGKNLTGMFLSIFWYLFLTAFLCIALSGKGNPGDPPIDISGRVLFLVVPIFFAVIPASSFLAAWRAQLKGRITADSKGIDVFDGKDRHTIAWSNLKLLEVRVQSSGNSGSIETLILVGSDDVITIPKGIDPYDQVKAFAMSHAPARTLLAL